MVGIKGKSGRKKSYLKVKKTLRLTVSQSEALKRFCRSSGTTESLVVGRLIDRMIGSELQQAKLKLMEAQSAFEYARQQFEIMREKEVIRLANLDEVIR